MSTFPNLCYKRNGPQHYAPHCCLFYFPVNFDAFPHTPVFFVSHLSTQHNVRTIISVAFVLAVFSPHPNKTTSKHNQPHPELRRKHLSIFQVSQSTLCRFLSVTVFVPYSHRRIAVPPSSFDTSRGKKSRLLIHFLRCLLLLTHLLNSVKWRSPFV